MYNGNGNGNNGNYGKYGFKKPQMLSKEEFSKKYGNETTKQATRKPETMFDYLRAYERYENKDAFILRFKVLYENREVSDSMYKAVLQGIQILEEDKKNK